jgi:hypothetical protein
MRLLREASDHTPVVCEFGIRQAETERTIESANGCSPELSCSLALLLKPFPIVGASCGERRD